MSALGYVLGLAAVWVMLWGTPSPANVLGGLAVAIVLVVVLPGLRSPRRRRIVRPLPLLRLAGTVLAGLVRSNVLLTRSILAGHRRLDTSIVEVEIPVCSDDLLTTIASLLALIPGTIPLEVHEEPRRLVVHVLHLDPLEESVHSIHTLVERCLDAFGDDPGPWNVHEGGVVTGEGQ